MEHTRRSFKSNLVSPSQKLIYALIRNIQDPEKGERLADDPNFQALMSGEKSQTRAA